MDDKFIGREEELRVLNETFKKNGFQGFLLYGRRRQGKTYLIKEAGKRFPGTVFYYQFVKSDSPAFNTQGMAQVMKTVFPDALIPDQASFQFLMELLFKIAAKQKILVALDEYQYYRNSDPSADSVLQRLIDGNRDGKREEVNLDLILSGSYVDVMLKMVGGDQPLFGRLQQKIFVKPFDYYDYCKLFPDTISNEEKLHYYSVFGGTPYTIKFLDPSKSFEENIKENLIAPFAPLAQEIDSNLELEFKKIDKAQALMSIISSGIKSYAKIKASFNQLYQTNGNLSYLLNCLIDMGLIEKKLPINSTNDKNLFYVIQDNLYDFYHYFIYPKNGYRQVLSTDDFFSVEVKDSLYKEYLPLKFEKIAKEFLIRRNKNGLNKVPFAKIGTYFYNDKRTHSQGQFDIVTEDEDGYTFIECKDTKGKVGLDVLHEEQQQVEKLKLPHYKLAFIAKNGFKDGFSELGYTTYSLEDFFDI